MRFLTTKNGGKMQCGSVQKIRNFVEIIENFEEEDLQEDINDFLSTLGPGARLVDIKYCVVEDDEHDMLHSAMIIYSKIEEEEKDDN